MTHLRRAAALFLALLALAGTATSAPSQAALAQTGGTLTSSPTSVTTSVALGATKKIPISLQNSGGAAVTPRLYEAFAASSPVAALAAVPADLAAVPLPDQAQRVDPQLSTATAAAPNAPTSFLVFLADQADLSAAYAISDWAQRGQYVYQTLRDHAARSQVGLRSFLDGRGVRYTPLWIVNALAVQGDASDLSALAARADVAMLRADHLTAFGDPTTGAALADVAGCLPDAANTCWNISRLGADRAWNNFGVRGAGVTVASIDSGVSYTHPALVGQYRGNKGGGVFDHNYNWYDPYGSATAPTDAGFHGTHTMGTMVASGGASASTPAVGMAPGARWIAARACGSSFCSETTLIEAAQWMLAPTDLSGQNPRPDMRPQIINNSWSSGTGNNVWYAGYVAAWRAAGIFPVFAAGNSGNASCSSIQSPGDYAQVVGVGALDSTDKIASFSNIGPSSDGRLKPDLTAPGVGIVSTSPDLTQPYRSLSGTSMATPEVAGGVALIWSANPSLIGDYDRTYQILAASASPISGDTRFDDPTLYSACHAATSPNNIYGHGRLDAYAAVAMASVDVPWLSLPATALSAISGSASASFDITIDARRVPGPGIYQARILVHSADLSLAPLVIPITLTVPADPNYATVSGRVTRLSDGTPLLATVSVTDGATASTDASGLYQIVLPPSATSYTLTVRSYSYAPKVTTVILGAGASLSRDFALESDAPHLTVSSDLLQGSVALGTPVNLALILRNNGTKKLIYSAYLPTALYGVWRSDQADGPAATWITPPADATTITLADDGISNPINMGAEFPFFGQSYLTVTIGANGILSFGSLSTTPASFTTGCLPIPETPGAALAPLRVDLDPSQPGARVSYARTADGFLVSWENVPLFDTLSQRLTFQALLRPDGRVTMNYLQVGTIAASTSAAIGAQGSTTLYQSLGCGSGLTVSSGETIELRPQPDAAFWASLPSRSGSINPGQQISLPVRLTWVRNPKAWPASAEILIDSNDPLRPEVRASARMTSAPAPFNTIVLLVMR